MWTERVEPEELGVPVEEEAEEGPEVSDDDLVTVGHRASGGAGPRRWLSSKEPKSHPVPTDDPDEADEPGIEDVALWGTGLERNLFLNPESEVSKRQLYGVMGGFFFGVVVVGILVALLRRYGSEGHTSRLPRGELQPATTLAAFSFNPLGTASSTDSALAWLLFQLLREKSVPLWLQDTATTTVPSQEGQASASSSAQQLADESPFRRWRPPTGAAEKSALELLASSNLARFLQESYELGPPRVRDISSIGAEAGDSEMDVFLAIRAFGRSKDELVLVSHPHHLPYLFILARASGFKASVLDPDLYKFVPWVQLGCSETGYPTGVSPLAQLAEERRRVAAFADGLKSQDPERFSLLSSVLLAADSTLQQYECDAGGTCAGNHT